MLILSVNDVESEFAGDIHLTNFTGRQQVQTGTQLVTTRIPQALYTPFPC